MYPKAVYFTGSCFLWGGGGVSGNLAYCAYFILALSCRPFFLCLVDVQEMMLWKTHVYRILFFLIKQHFRREGRGGAEGGLGLSVNPPVLP